MHILVLISSNLAEIIKTTIFVADKIGIMDNRKNRK